VNTNLMKSLMAAVGIVLALGATAQAADFCMEIGSTVYVGRSFRIPSPGQCKPFNGFPQGHPGDVVTGTGCTASDGSHVTFDLQESFLDQQDVLTAVTTNVQIALPGLTGTSHFYDSVAQFGGSDFVIVVTCIPHVIPVP